MKLQEDIEKLVLFDKKSILSEVDYLKVKLQIGKKINDLIEFIDDLDSIYLINLDLEKNEQEIKQQIQNNRDKKLEMWCYIHGKKKYIKSFGTIEFINNTMLKDIFKFLTLIRLVKKVNEVIYYASQYYRSDKLFIEEKEN